MIAQNKSKLFGFLPFLDSDGIMGAKGRLRKAHVEYQTKHPIILHNQHWAVKFFQEEMHKTWHHDGVEYLRSFVKQKKWILGFRNALRSVKHDCVQGKKFARTINLQMFYLPASRLQAMVYPSSNCGVDYFAPF